MSKSGITILILFVILFFDAFIVLPQGKRQLAFSWKDFNGETMHLSFTIDRDSLQKAKEEFGVPKSQTRFFVKLPAKVIHLQWRTEKEKWQVLQKVRNDSLHRIRTIDSLRAVWRKSILQRGFVERNGKLEADFRFLYRRNFKRLDPVFDSFQNYAKSKNYNLNQEINLMLSFVQSIPYRTIPAVREGTNILTSGVLTPLEVLAEGYGDCDSKSLLFAILIGHLKRRVILISFKIHAIVGYEDFPINKKGTIQYQGRHYILCEASHTYWRPGDLSNDLLKLIKKGKYQVIDLP